MAYSVCHAVYIDNGANYAMKWLAYIHIHAELWKLETSDDRVLLIIASASFILTCIHLFNNSFDMACIFK